MKRQPDKESSAGSAEAAETRADNFELVYFRPLQNQKAAPCGANCPSGVRVREWVGLIAQRSKLGLTKEQAYRQAWERIVDKNPFPATMGRICPHPCETDCNRVDLDGAVAVNDMERFLGDWGIEEGLALPRLQFEQRDESVGVVGAGPAGLSFAYQMARRGYAVTVYDRHDHPGGMLRFGIPDYRLPPSVLGAEIARIVDLGVELKTGVRVGEEVHLESLREKHDALFVGVGAQAGRGLAIPGWDGPGVHVGTEYLLRVNKGHEVAVGPDVVVVGGGNTAIDAARTARRQGANVTLLYRRTRNEMPAIEAEVLEAEEEGVDIRYLCAPSTIRRNEHGPVSVSVQRMRLGELDGSGRRRPVPIDDSFFDITASAVIAAISQEPDWAAIKDLNQRGGWIATAENGHFDGQVYAGGDVRGPGVASLAIGQGRAAAEAAHARLRGLQIAAPFETSSEVIESDGLKLDLYPRSPRIDMVRAPIEDRLADPKLEVTRSMSEERFLRETERCLSCGSCFGCHHCWMYCNAAGFVPVDDSEPGNYFLLDLSVCEGCGKCVDVCPTGYLSTRPRT